MDLQALAAEESDDECCTQELWLPDILDKQARIISAIQSLQGTVSAAELQALLESCSVWPSEQDYAIMSADTLRNEWECRYEEDRAMQRRLHELRGRGEAVIAPELGLSQFSPADCMSRRNSIQSGRCNSMRTPNNGQCGVRKYSAGGTATHGYVPFGGAISERSDTEASQSPVLQIHFGVDETSPYGCGIEPHATQSPPGQLQFTPSATGSHAEEPLSSAQVTSCQS